MAKTRHWAFRLWAELIEQGKSDDEARKFIRESFPWVPDIDELIEALGYTSKEDIDTAKAQHTREQGLTHMNQAIRAFRAANRVDLSASQGSSSAESGQTNSANSEAKPTKEPDMNSILREFSGRSRLSLQ